MNYKLRHIRQPALVLGLCLFSTISQAGSIQIMEPSTSKIEVFDTTGSGSIVHLGASSSSMIDVIGSHKVVAKTQPMAEKIMPDVMKVISTKPKLPIVSVNEIRKK